MLPVSSRLIYKLNSNKNLKVILKEFDKLYLQINPPKQIFKKEIGERTVRERSPLKKTKKNKNLTSEKNVFTLSMRRLRLREVLCPRGHSQSVELFLLHNTAPAGALETRHCF